MRPDTFIQAGVLKPLAITATALALTVIVGLYSYKQSQQWRIYGSGPVLSLSGDDDSFTIQLSDISHAKSIVNTKLFHGVDPETAEDALPNGLSIAGHIDEDGVIYGVIPVKSGKVMLHSYTQDTEDGAYGANIVEFRPNGMRLYDIITKSSIPTPPNECKPTWVSVWAESSNDRYLIELTGNLVHRFIWQRTWP